MTAKKISRKSVDRQQWRQYYEVGIQNKQGAEHNLESGLWTPAGILIVHSAIALTDALTVKAAGVKSSGDGHLQVVELVKQVIEISRDDTGALNRLLRILSEKSKVAYGGQLYTERQAAGVMKQLQRYQAWIDKKLESIP